MRAMPSSFMYRLFKSAIACLTLVVCAAGAAPAIVTDLAGRSVRLPQRVDRILLGESRLIPALAILERGDPFSRVVGMPSDFEQLDPAGFAQFSQRFERARTLPRTGRNTAESFSLERAIELKPDIAIFGLGGHGPLHTDKETLARLSAAGVTVLFIDIRQEPLRNTVPSMLVMGAALGRDKEATEFATEYNKQLALVTQRLALARPALPTVFLENRVGLSQECCDTMTNGLMGRMVEAAGGVNIAKSLVPGTFGTISLEYLLSHPPQVYIGTAIGNADAAQKMPNRLILGAGVEESVAKASLLRVTQRPGFSALPTLREPTQVHAIWHHFYTSPFNVVAVQVMAKWLHPKLFADLEPRQTLANMYKRFQPVPLSGQYWTSLGATATP